MPETTNDPHYFDFDLGGGIRDQVVEKLVSTPMLALAKGVGPQASGIYALYYKSRVPGSVARRRSERAGQ